MHDRRNTTHTVLMGMEEERRQGLMDRTTQSIEVDSVNEDCIK
jgi:hypothetical protein